MTVQIEKGGIHACNACRPPPSICPDVMTWHPSAKNLIEIRINIDSDFSFDNSNLIVEKTNCSHSQNQICFWKVQIHAAFSNRICAIVSLNRWWQRTGSPTWLGTVLDGISITTYWANNCHACKVSCKQCKLGSSRSQYLPTHSFNSSCTWGIQDFQRSPWQEHDIWEDWFWKNVSSIVL